MTRGTTMVTILLMTAVLLSPIMVHGQIYDGAWTNASDVPTFIVDGGQVTYFSSELIYFCCCWWQITTSDYTTTPSPISGNHFEVTLSTSDGTFLFKGYFTSASVCTGTYSMTSASCFGGGNWTAIKAGSSMSEPSMASSRCTDTGISLGITNVTPNATNYVLCAHSLMSGGWVTAAVFQTSSTGTNWSEAFRPSNTFYKIESRR